MSNRQLEDIYDEQRDEHISNLLGITLEEYQDLNHRGIEEQTSSDGMVYGQYMQFSDDNSKEILSKIKGLDSTNTVYFEIGTFG